jgi:hypothetical protein
MEDQFPTRVPRAAAAGGYLDQAEERAAGAALATRRLRASAQQADDGKEARTSTQLMLRRWQEDPALACVRDREALGKFPEPERAAWAKLWADVQRLLDRAAERPSQPRDGAKKP